jgi:hypothetical protein
VINTCAFIDPAKAESTETILEHARASARAAADRRGLPLAALRRRAAGADPRDRRRRRHRRVRRIVELLDDARAGLRPVRLGFEAEPEHDFCRAWSRRRGDGVSQDRRRLRSSVHVLHHPAAARRVPLARKSRSWPKRARSRGRHERADPDRAGHVDVRPRSRLAARRSRRAAARLHEIDGSSGSGCCTSIRRRSTTS